MRNFFIGINPVTLSTVCTEYAHFLAGVFLMATVEGPYWRSRDCQQELKR